MRLSKLILFTASIILFGNSYAQQKQEPTKINWKSGLTLQSADNNFKVKIGGRIQYDHAFFSQNNELEQATAPLMTKNGTQFRRVWLSNTGTIYGNVDFGLYVAFENGRVGLRGAYVGVKDIPVLGSIRVGQLKEPLRLEVSTSSKHTLFMERSFSVDFAPIFNSGILINNDFLNKKLSAQFGLFRNADLNKANDIAANEGYNITQRITGLPIKTENSFLHIGGSYSYRKPNSGTYQLRSRPESNLTEVRYVDTELIENVDHSNLVNIEALYGIGAFNIQSEYLVSNVKRTTGIAAEDLNFSTFYAQMSYCLTGEKRSYKSSLAGIGSVKPNRNFGKNSPGAWEVAAKYSTVNLNDGAIAGGKENNLQLGLNWYLNPLTKVMMNHVWAEMENQGKLNVFQVRFQIGF
ncbi:OprO/OprP family phosphate-selective porin [Flavicella sediminum]|uniref:OprO/OprP family phosphate-selective porin n=1 Tax=Flavicella sediminum TaxID=2585141 RepID=UPI00111DBB5C|nr:porin [Flavicella sediminum]